MKSLNLTMLLGAAPRHGAIRVVMRAIALAREFPVRAYRARRDTRHLMRFNDHMLRDIGIVRSEIEAGAHGEPARWH